MARKTGDYSLTFRCVNCGRVELFASFPSRDVVNEDEVRARIYEASCNCGWKGNACGYSAIHISRASGFKAKAGGR
jgi:hypothetical protein